MVELKLGKIAMKKRCYMLALMMSCLSLGIDKLTQLAIAQDLFSDMATKVEFVDKTKWRANEYILSERYQSDFSGNISFVIPSGKITVILGKKRCR